MIASVPLRPIASSLLRNRVTLTLITLQIALTLALICNALFVIIERMSLMNRPSGMNEVDTFVLSTTSFSENPAISASIKADLLTLRGLAGVKDAAPIVAIPTEGGGWTEDVYRDRNQKNPTSDDVAVYFTDERGLDAYGAHLIAGRNFSPGEIGLRDADNETSQWPSVVIVTRALAEHLFPNETALGKQFDFDKAEPMTIIGIVDRLQASDPHHTNVSGDPDLVEYSVVVPQILYSTTSERYLIRAEPGRRDDVMRTAVDALLKTDRNRTVEHVNAVQDLRKAGYGSDRAMIVILSIVVGCLLVVTGLGIVGLATYWVSQRTKQIGVRRALGATRRDVLAYFMAENMIITSLGLLLGTLFAYALNIALRYAVGEALLPGYYLPAGFAVLFLLGQAAVLGPALSASRIAPATAARTV